MLPNEEHLRTIQRILVALDSSEHSLAALDVAASLAAQLQAELEALFIEDLDLLRLADLPCAQVTSVLLMETERIDRERMERRLRLQAERIHRALQRRAAALGVRVTFRSVRGNVEEEVRAAAAEADLLGLGKADYRYGGVSGFGPTLQAALVTGRPLLVLESRPLVGRGLLAIYDGSRAGVRATALAAELARRTRQELHVLALAGSPSDAQQLGAEVQVRLKEQDVQPYLSYAWGEPAQAILSAARRLRPALLLLGLQGDEGAGQGRTDRVLEAVRCPLLLVP